MSDEKGIILTPDSLTALNEERKKRNSLRPREEDFKGRPGYWREPKMIEAADGSLVEDPSGAYQWGFDYQTNEGGTPTKIGAEVQDMLAPSMRADEEYKLNGGARHIVEGSTPVEGLAAPIGWTRTARTQVSVGRGSDRMPDYRVRRIASDAAVSFATAYAWARGRIVSGWARRRIEAVR